jgi:hypothetical protein
MKPDQTPSTTQQLYKLISSHDRKTAWWLQDIRDSVREGHYEVLRQIAFHEERRIRTLRIGFGLCAATLLIAGGVNYRETKNLESWTRTEIELRNVIIEPTEHVKPYTVELTDEGNCVAYEVSGVIGIKENGYPVKEKKPVATFTLPGMPECKP